MHCSDGPLLQVRPCWRASCSFTSLAAACITVVQDIASLSLSMHASDEVDCNGARAHRTRSRRHRSSHHREAGHGRSRGRTLLDPGRAQTAAAACSPASSSALLTPAPAFFFTGRRVKCDSPNVTHCAPACLLSLGGMQQSKKRRSAAACAAWTSSRCNCFPAHACS